MLAKPRQENLASIASTWQLCANMIKYASTCRPLNGGRHLLQSPCCLLLRKPVCKAAIVSLSTCTNWQISPYTHSDLVFSCGSVLACALQQMLEHVHLSSTMVLQTRFASLLHHVGRWPRVRHGKERAASFLRHTRSRAACARRPQVGSWGGAERARHHLAESPHSARQGGIEPPQSSKRGKCRKFGQNLAISRKAMVHCQGPGLYIYRIPN